MSPENNDQTRPEPGEPEVGALPDEAGSLPANGFPEEKPENPPCYEGNGAG